MSMLSGQADSLRNEAKRYSDINHAHASMLRDAADTILQLRDDLQQANASLAESEHDESVAWDRVRAAEAENAKLLKLAQDMFTILSNNEPCFVWEDMTDRARELGIEVDE